MPQQSAALEDAQPAAPVRMLDSSFLNSSTAPAGLAVVVLNWRLPSITPRLLEKACYRICADGGANRLHDEVPAMFPGEEPDAVRTRLLPHLIKGDLDSIRPDVVAFYESHGVPVVDLSADQDTTDLAKCLEYLQRIAGGAGGEGVAPAGEQGSERDGPASEGERRPTHGAAARAGEQSLEHDGLEAGQREPPPAEQARAQPPPPLRQPGQRLPVGTVVAVGAQGGRLDHILSNLSTLHTFRDMNIVLCGEGNLTRLVPAGKASIRPDRRLEGPSCGLVPLQGPAVASTSGLRWNLACTEMRIGGLVSTSNILEADEVEVESDTDLIWTTQLREPQDAGDP